jgi:hypothetical protein
VADVEKIEAAVGEDDTTAISSGSRRELGEFRNRLEFGRGQQVPFRKNYNALPCDVARITHGRQRAQPNETMRRARVEFLLCRA